MQALKLAFYKKLGKEGQPSMTEFKIHWEELAGNTRQARTHSKIYISSFSSLNDCHFSLMGGQNSSTCSTDATLSLCMQCVC